MKNKTLTILLLAALAALSAVPADAQRFEGLSVGAGAGTDGLTAEISKTIGRRFLVRAGYSFASLGDGIRIKNINIPVHPGDAVGPGDIDGPDVDVPLHVSASISAARLLINYYPAANDAVYICAGVFAGPGDYIRINATSMPEDYGNAGINIDGKTIRAVDGTLRGRILQNTVRPYLGFGFGKPYSGYKWNVTLDIGVQYMGSEAQLQGWGTGPAGDGWVTVRRDQVGNFTNYYDEANRILKIWPTLSLRVWFSIM